MNPALIIGQLPIGLRIEGFLHAPALIRGENLALFVGEQQADGVSLLLPMRGLMRGLVNGRGEAARDIMGWQFFRLLGHRLCSISGILPGVPIQAKRPLG
ncbi:MAG: hypothetical protein RLZZ57_1038 [Pseudomonadota bacterium]